MKRHIYRSLLPAFCALILGALFAPSIQAQTDYSYRGALSRLSIGVGASFGFAVPVGDLTDTSAGNHGKIDEAAPGFATRFGLNLSYPLSRTIRLHLASGLDIRNVGKKLHNFEADGTELNARSYHVQYFYIEPGFSYSAFKLSLNIGMPMSATQPVPDPTGTVATDQTMEVPSDKMEMMLEPRLEASLVLIDEELGWLGLTFGGGFPLNTLFKKDDTSGLYQTEGDIPVTRALNLQLGLTYQFAIPGTGSSR
jgi:hypothetical protein